MLAEGCERVIDIKRSASDVANLNKRSNHRKRINQGPETVRKLNYPSFPTKGREPCPQEV